MTSKVFVRTTLAFASGLVAAAAHAQAPAPVIKTDGEWRGTGGLAFSMAKSNANSTSTALLLNADGYRATAQDKITAGGFINKASTKAGGTTADTADAWNLFGQYDWNLTQQLFAFGRLGFEGNGLARLDLRTQVAGGVGYKVINTPNLAFTVYGGVGYVSDKYEIIGTSKRTSLYLAEESTHKLSDTVSFKQRLDLYPGLTGDKAKIARFTAGLSVAMSSTLSMNVGLIHNYNSKPPVIGGTSLSKGDTALFTGVNVKLGAL